MQLLTETQKARDLYNMEPIPSIMDSMHGINTSLALIADGMSQRSVFDSQWFSALTGAAAALFIFLAEKIFSWRIREAEKLLDYCKWLNEQWSFRSPDMLLDDARSTVYGHFVVNALTGEKRVVPEKLLGDKMIITLRRNLKWWRQPNRRLHTYFKEYENSLRKFNELQENQPEVEREFINKSLVSYEKIDRYAFAVTGDSEHTID